MNVGNVALGFLGTVVIGAGSMLIRTDAVTHENAADVMRIDNTINMLSTRLDSIDKHLNQLSADVAVTNQKLDDMDTAPRKVKP